MDIQIGLAGLDTRHQRISSRENRPTLEDDEGGVVGSAVAASSEEFQNGRMAVAAAGKDSWFLPVHRKYRTLSPRSPAEEHRTVSPGPAASQ